MECVYSKSSAWGTHSKPAGEFFTKLSRAARQDLRAMQVPSSYAANMVIFTEKDPAQGIYIVLEGEVKVSINSSDGRRLSLAIVGTAEILGMGSTLAGRPYDVTAETVFPAKLAYIERREFMDFLSRHPGTYQVVIAELSRNITKACDHLRTVGLPATVSEKLALLLLGWSEDGEPAERGGRQFRLSMTHEELGEFIGASRETVTRTLNNFKHRRLVNLKGSMITIPNRDALARYAHS
jgi:CRP/FNR family transcriptional regulator, cyclic AMP receptor protein